MKKVIMAAVLSMAATMAQAGWNIQDNTDGFTGSIRASCGASVASGSTVDCGDIIIQVGGKVAVTTTQGFKKQSTNLRPTNLP